MSRRDDSGGAAAPTSNRALREFAAALRGDRTLQTVALIAVVARVAVFVATLFFPIPNERGYGVSPLLEPSYFDFDFYLESAARYFEAPGALLDEFLRFYRDPFAAELPRLISGPIFPLLMEASGFNRGSYLPLSLAYLILGCSLVVLWLWWLRSRGVSVPFLVAFALLPNAIWFTLVVSTDLAFAAEFAVFYLSYFARRPSRATAVTWSVALVLMVLTRPNSFSVLLFVALDAAWTFMQERRIHVWRATAIAVLTVVSALYLYPYFLGEMRKAGTALQYFDYAPAEYAAGLFAGLPRWLDLALSWTALLGAKLLYFTGLRPTYGITAPMFVLLRAAPGLVLLPGLLALLVQAPWRERALVALYCLPFFLGPSQDRYYLAIYPLLFLYGARLYEELARRARSRLVSAPSA